MTIDITGVIAGEKRRCGRNLVGATLPAKWRDRIARLQRIWLGAKFAPHQRRIDHAAFERMPLRPKRTAM